MSALQELKSMLLDERPFDLQQAGWAYEIKFDGYRLLAEFGQGRCVLRTRNGANATTWLPEITRPLSNIKLFPDGPYVVDGEVCVMDEMGRSDFDRLHARAKHRSFYGGCDPVTFCVFDLLLANGTEQTQLPYLERKERLQRLFKPTLPGILYVGHFESDGERLYNGAVLPLELEGLVAKRMDRPYEPDVRSINWVKVKRKGAVPAERFRRPSPAG
jgi:bifunctional non-homologous end joining protein LigD